MRKSPKAGIQRPNVQAAPGTGTDANLEISRPAAARQPSGCQQLVPQRRGGSLHRCPRRVGIEEDGEFVDSNVV